MDKRKPGRPRAEYPYVCGPYKHGAKWRLVVRTSRSGGRHQGFARTFKSQQEARTWQREYERQVAGAGRTVQDAIDAFIANTTRKGLKSTSLTTARHQLDAMLDGTMSLVDLNARRAQEAYDALVTRGVAVDTHRGALAKCRSFGAFCVKQGWMRANPFIDIEGVGRRNKGKKQLNIDESRTYEAVCFAEWQQRRDRGAAAGLLALMFSLRASEVSQLMVRDVDDKGRILRVAEQDAKTDSSKRLAEVPAQYRPMLRELAANPATQAGHLFSLDRGAKKGKPADRHWVLRNVRRLMKLAGVKVITAHGLRGTGASIGAATSGAKVMSEALGHTSVSMTKAHYIDAGSSADARAQRFVDMLTGDDEPMSEVGTKLDE